MPSDPKKTRSHKPKPRGSRKKRPDRAREQALPVLALHKRGDALVALDDFLETLGDRPLEDLTLADVETGIEDPQLERAVAVAFSRFAMSRTAIPGPIETLGRALIEFATAHSEDDPPLLPGIRTEVLDDKGEPTGQYEYAYSGISSEAALRRLEERGLPKAKLNLLWSRVTGQKGLNEWEATMPPGVLVTFFPPLAWQAAAALVQEGPQHARWRLQAALNEFARTQVEGSSHRAAGNIAQATLEGRKGAIERFMSDLIKCRSHGSGQLAAWEQRPTLEAPRGAVEDPVHLATPELPDVRMRWAQAYQDLLDALAKWSPQKECKPGGEIACIQAMKPWRMQKSGVWTLARELALMTLLINTGTRAEALLETNVSNFQESWPVGGSVGPTLLLDHLKGQSDEVFSNKALPEGIAHILRVWLAVLAYYNGRRNRWRELGEPERWPNDLPEPELPPGDWPLFPSYPGYLDQRWSYSAVLRAVRGHEKDKQEGWLPIVADNPYHCFTPHRYRAFASTQLERRKAARFMDDHHIDLTQRYLSEVLLDHSVGSSEDDYKLARRVGREEYAAAAVQIMWALLTTDAGATWDLDKKRYRYLLRDQQTEAAMRRKLDREFDELVGNHEKDGAQADNGAFQREMAKLQKLGQDLAERKAETSLALREIETRSRAYFVPLPDDLSTLSEQERLDLRRDLADIRLDVLGFSDRTGGILGGRTKRRWLTIQELADLVGISTQQLNKWIDKKVTPKGVPVWMTATAPLTGEGKRRRFWTDAFNPEWLNEGRRHETLNGLLQEWPTKQNWKVFQTKGEPEATPPEIVTAIEAMRSLEAAVAA